MATSSAKLTLSLKRRLANGDEIFIAPGVEESCSADDLDAAQARVTERVKGWLEQLVSEFPDASGEEDDAGEEDEATDDDATDDEEGLTAEDIDGMDKKALVALIKENDLEVEGAAKMKLDDLREAVKEACGMNEEDAGEDDDATDDEDAGEDGDDDNAGYTEAELKKMSLEDLQEVCESWEIDHPAFKKGTKPDLKTKKAAYIKHILASQDAEE